MEDKLNLIEILKNAPNGTKLWSPICGECWLNKVDTDTTFPIKCKTKGYQGARVRITFTARGEYNDNYANCECVLFPSKDNHDWSTFEIHEHKEFKPFQKMLRIECNDHDRPIWAADFYSHYDEDACVHYFVSGFIVSDDDIIPYEGNEDKLGKPVE